MIYTHNLSSLFYFVCYAFFQAHGQNTEYSIIEYLIIYDY